MTIIYEICYVEDGTYYVDILESNIIKKYILNEYVKNIKNSRLFSDLIEINAILIILKRPIIILEKLNFTFNETFFMKLIAFINEEN